MRYRYNFFPINKEVSSIPGSIWYMLQSNVDTYYRSDNSVFIGANSTEKMNIEPEYIAEWLSFCCKVKFFIDNYSV